MASLLPKIALCFVAGCSAAATQASTTHAPEATRTSPDSQDYTEFYAALANSTSAVDPESVLDLDDGQAEDVEVRVWSLRQALPAQHSTLRGKGRGHVAVLLATPGAYGGAAMLADSSPFHRTMPVQGDSWLMGANDGWLETAPFVSDGRGTNFSAQWPIDDDLAFDVAHYGPSTPNPWGLHGRVHVIDAEVVRGERGGTVILGARRIDGGEEQPNATSILLGMAKRFEARREQDLQTLRDSLRRTHGVTATQDVTWVFPTFDTDTKALRAFFYRRVTGEREGHGQALAASATEYTVDLGGRLLRTRRFSPRTEASWEPSSGVPRSLPPTTASHSRLVHVSARMKLDVRPTVETHATWELDALIPKPEMPPGKPAAETIEEDFRAMQWDDDETWWPVHSLEPTDGDFVKWGTHRGPVRQQPSDPGDATPQVIRLVKRELNGGLVSTTVLPKGDVLPDLLVAVRAHFGAELDRRGSKMARVRAAIGKAGGQEPTGRVTETISARTTWLPESQRAQILFIAKQAEQRLGPYNGGPANEDPNAKSVYAWDSTFAIVYEVDLDGVVHRRDVYPPRGHENWSLPKP